LRFGFTKNKLE